MASVCALTKVVNIEIAVSPNRKLQTSVHLLKNQIFGTKVPYPSVPFFFTLYPNVSYAVTRTESARLSKVKHCGPIYTDGYQYR